MAYNIGVRSPYFVTFGSASGERFQLTITINGVLRYTLVKVQPDSASFEISELVRDYIDISYNGTMPLDPSDESSGYSAEVSLGYKIWANPEGTGTPTQTGITLQAFDAYKYFSDSDFATYNLPSTAILLSSKTIWLPQNTAGTFYYTVDTVLFKGSISTNGISAGAAGETITIKRYDCSRYEPIKLVFINRFGMPQELWFFGKTIENSSFSSDNYKSANITAGGTYNRYEHQYKKLDVKGQTSYTINTAFVSEDYNESIKELLLSEQVWMHIGGVVRPINVNSSSVAYRTSLNDKLVEYTMEVSQASDLISNVR